MENTATTTREKKIPAERTVSIRIPMDPLNKWDKTVPVTINGVRTEYPRGELIAVPEGVAKILEEAGYLG